MNRQLIVIDDFYANVDDVRNHVLTMDFSVTGNYPGARTAPVPEPQFSFLKEYFSKEVLDRVINFWPGSYNTSFQYTTEGVPNWIHHDETNWAGICYLTPNPPENSGTTLFSLRENGVFQHKGGQIDYNSFAEYTEDESKWKPEITIENRYNRLILYNGFCYHRATIPGFGTCKETGRLFQVFFFNTLDKI